MTRLTATILALAAGAVLLGGAAAAHAYVLRSNPAPDARLQRPPNEVRISFTEPVVARGSDIAVLTTGGRRVDLADVHPSEDENGLAVSLTPIAEGGYLVTWTALSNVDGHTTRGSFAFAVGDAPLPAIPDVGEAAPPPTALEIAGRALSFAGIALAIGVPLFLLVIRPPADERERRRERALAALAGSLLVAGSAGILAAQGGIAPGRFALLLGLRAAAGLAVLAGLRLPLRDGPRREATVAWGVAAALSATLVSHAAAYGGPLDSALDLLHVLAISVWLGGVVALLVVVLPTARVRDDVEAAALGATVWRFSLVALVAVATLVTTGVLQSLQRLVLLQDLVETPYGLALLAKIALLVATLGFGALNLLVYGPRLRRALAPEAARRGILRGTFGETALLAVVLVAAAFLTAFAPPAQPSGAAFDETQHVGGLRLQLLVPAAQPGRNRFVLRVQDGPRPVTDAPRVALRFTMVEHDMGENELLMEQRAPGEYVAEGSTLAMFGTWHVEAIVRRIDRDDVRTVFTVPVGAGTGAVARVLPVGDRTLIVFSDPAAPVAGAPVTVHAVVVDAKGDPVPGLTLRASFEGPVARDPRALAETGTGRYALALDALEAGTWRIALSVDGQAAPPFELEVAR